MVKCPPFVEKCSLQVSWHGDQIILQGKLLFLQSYQSALWANSWIDTWFFGLYLMLSGLGNFVVDCHI